MDTNFISLVGTFIDKHGFPIVVCGALFWYIVTETRANRKILEEIKGVLSENTKVMMAFTDLVKEWTRNG